MPETSDTHRGWKMLSLAELMHALSREGRSLSKGRNSRLPALCVYVEKSTIELFHFLPIFESCVIAKSKVLSLKLHIYLSTEKGKEFLNFRCFCDGAIK